MIRVLLALLLAGCGWYQPAQIACVDGSFCPDGMVCVDPDPADEEPGRCADEAPDDDDSASDDDDSALDDDDAVDDDDVSDDDDSGDDDDTPPVAVDTTLTGVVRDAWGAPVEGVAVATSHGFSGVSDEEGRFAFAVDPAPEALISFAKEGYPPAALAFDLLEGVENALHRTMAEVDVVQTFLSTDGLGPTFIDEHGATFELPPDNFLDSSGVDYVGNVTVEATFYDVTAGFEDGNELFAVPGDFVGIDLEGSPQRIETWGVVQLRLWGDGGEPLNLGLNAAPIRLPLQIQDAPDASVPDGATVPAWSFDVSTGRWVEGGAGGLVQEPDGTWFWELDAPYVGTWIVAEPLPVPGCISGTVSDSAGAPRPGATVQGVGFDYSSVSTTRSLPDGSFCAEVLAGGTAWLDLSHSTGAQPAALRSDPVAVPVGTCDGFDCADLGVLPLDIMTCVTGLVVSTQGSPVANVDVVSPQGGLAQTDLNGGFCLGVPVYGETTAYVFTGADEEGYRPKRLFTQVGLPGCQSGCPNIAILRPYSETTCAAGEVLINSQAAAAIPVEAYDPDFADLPVFSTVTASDGSYCVEVPVVSSPVSVRVGSPPNLCDEEAVSTDAAGGPTCAESPGSCVAVPTLSCSL